MRRGERMVRRIPALAALIPLEHGKIRDPQETKILLRVAGLLEDAVPLSVFLSQRQSQQSRRRINRQLLRRNLAIAWKRCLLATLRRPRDDHDEIASLHSCLGCNLRRSLPEILLNPLEVFEYLCAALGNKHRLYRV